MDGVGEGGGDAGSWATAVVAQERAAKKPAWRNALTFRRASSLRKFTVEVEVRQENVDPGFSEEAERPALDVTVDERGDLLLGHAPRLRDPCGLPQRRVRRE